MYEVLEMQREKCSAYSPLSRFKGFSGRNHKFLKDKDDKQLLSEIAALNTRVRQLFSNENVRTMSGITKRPCNLLPKYAHVNFKELSTEYLVNVNGSAELIKCLFMSVLLDGLYTAFIREKILSLSHQNLYDNGWSEASMAVKCSYSKTHLMIFFLERYSYRTIQGWFEVSEKTSSLVNQLLNPKTKYSLNEGPVSHERQIGVGYKDKGNLTPEHLKIVEIDDSRTNLVRPEFIPTLKNSFSDWITLTALGVYSEKLKIKLKLFNSKEEEYEQHNRNTIEERSNSGRKLTSTAGPNIKYRPEGFQPFWKDFKSAGRDNSFTSREDKEIKTHENVGIFNSKEERRNFCERYSEIGDRTATEQLRKSPPVKNSNSVGEILFEDEISRKWRLLSERYELYRDLFDLTK